MIMERLNNSSIFEDVIFPQCPCFNIKIGEIHKRFLNLFYELKDAYKSTFRVSTLKSTKEIMKTDERDLCKSSIKVSSSHCLEEACATYLFQE